MNMTNEQIQALKAPFLKTITSLLAGREADKTLIAEQRKSIDFLKEQLAQLANFNPDWDKIEAATDSLREHMAELTEANKRIAELEAALNLASASYAGERERADALQARTVTVKLPESVIDAICLTAAEIHNLGRGVSDDRAQEIINSIRCAAGITLVVGE